MTRLDRVKFIQEIAKRSTAFDDLEEELSSLPKQRLSQELLDCGIIPERYPHDSSEEKLWAKYCDVLLSMSLNHLGLRSQVIRARGDSADILATTDDYTIVGDAKAFRLSRTAKNQKDFKVSALDDWRRQNTYACLVSPLYQYPTRTSQIYIQAERKNVTLFSYVHLKFLLDHPPTKSLNELWITPRSISPSKDARIYWEHIDDVVVALTNESYEKLRAYKKMEVDETTAIGNEGIEYWLSVIDGYHKLSKEEAVKRLIKAEKIEQKIVVIQQAIQKANDAYND